MKEKRKPKKPTERELEILRDKSASNPGLLHYAHHVGSGVVKPIDRGKVKGRSVQAMYEQTDQQLLQIREQIQLLASQAEQIRNRVEISERIYLSEMSFEPLIGHCYYLYQKADGQDVLSMVSPAEWGHAHPYRDFIAEVKLQADHTWEIRKNNNK